MYVRQWRRCPRTTLRLRRVGSGISARTVTARETFFRRRSGTRQQQLAGKHGGPLVSGPASCRLPFRASAPTYRALSRHSAVLVSATLPPRGRGGRGDKWEDGCEGIRTARSPTPVRRCIKSIYSRPKRYRLLQGNRSRSTSSCWLTNDSSDSAHGIGLARDMPSGEPSLDDLRLGPIRDQQVVSEYPESPGPTCKGFVK